MSVPLTHDAIVRGCGPLPDWKIASIERTGGSWEDLEIALAFAAGEDDVMGEARLPLTGKAQSIYEILMAGELENDDR
jgi:hypothetical protein